MELELLEPARSTTILNDMSCCCEWSDVPSSWMTFESSTLKPLTLISRIPIIVGRSESSGPLWMVCYHNLAVGANSQTAFTVKDSCTG